MKTWMFFDWWHFEGQSNMEIKQGEPELVPESAYADPTFDYLGCWPTIYQESGKWKMLYFISGLPMCLMAAESDDGINWKPSDCSDIDPGGEKYAPNHIFTVPSANGGPIYLDPAAKDGKPFKFYCIQRGGPAAERAKHDKNSMFHELVTGEGIKPYMADNLLFGSEDGLNWELEKDVNFNYPAWHPDPPLACFYNHQTETHTMVTRPGWGDRRIAVITSDDAREWSAPELIMQPDVSDPPLMQFYGMPVSHYKNYYIGFLWMAKFGNSETLDRFNQLYGYIDSQLTYSFDGKHFQRMFREPFIKNSDPDLPGSGVVYPTIMIETDEELRIYSASTMDLHHQNTDKQFVRKGEVPASSIIMHKLRKDGFTYLSSCGHWGEFTTKPLVMKELEIFANIQVPHGDMLYQITDLFSKPIEGFTFDDCVAFKNIDSISQKLTWKSENDMSSLKNKVIRLQIKMRNGRLYSFSGDFHFVDALDVTLINDHKPIKDDFFDF
jgi:hypothetical protein